MLIFFWYNMVRINPRRDARQMIPIKNGKFQKHGVAFALPEGFCYNSDPDCVHEDGIEFVSKDESKVLNYDFLTSEEKSYDALNVLFKEDFLGFYNFHMLTPITPILLNGLFGHHVLYKSSDSPDEPSNQYYELNLDLGECEEGYLMFSLRINDLEGDIMSYVESDEFKQIFSVISRVDE